MKQNMLFRIYSFICKIHSAYFLGAVISTGENIHSSCPLEERAINDNKVVYEGNKQRLK